MHLGIPVSVLLAEVPVMCGGPQVRFHAGPEAEGIGLATGTRLSLDIDLRKGDDVENWDEIRTAFQVARLGTVSGAAEVLGVHHATVIRHIDALEARLGTKLFQRHARGYTATEAGRDLLQVAKVTDEQFSQLAGRIKGGGNDVSGELIVTSLSVLSSRLTPVLAAFQSEHPGVVVRFLTDERLFRLEYGEAHVAIRAGKMPEEPDNVVQPLGVQRQAIYAARSYIERRGMPTEATLGDHAIVGFDGAPRAPFLRWLHDAVPDEALVWRATDAGVMHDAIRAGVGLGFLPCSLGAGDPTLVQVLRPRPEWDAPLWIVTHVDLHRTAKVQAFLGHLKEAAKGWAE